jgi:endonuclease YncB( thermonuclease family)
LAPAQTSPWDSDFIWKRAGNPHVRHPVDVLTTIDGNTFEARVHLWPGLDLTKRLQLRGIDAPELKAQCTACCRTTR